MECFSPHYARPDLHTQLRAVSDNNRDYRDCDRVFLVTLSRLSCFAVLSPLLPPSSPTAGGRGLAVGLPSLPLTNSLVRHSHSLAARAASAISAYIFNPPFRALCRNPAEDEADDEVTTEGTERGAEGGGECRVPLQSLLLAPYLTLR